MKKLRVLSVFGTRPEAIKMIPLVRELARQEAFESLCAVTAQHRQMLDSVLDIFQIKPDFDLDIMEPGQTLSTITSKCLTGMDEAIEALRKNRFVEEKRFGNISSFNFTKERLLPEGVG